MSRHYCLISGNAEQTKDFLSRLSWPLNDLVERVEYVLDMWPDGLDIKIELSDDADGVRAAYLDLYEKQVDYIAFTRLSTQTIYISVADTSDRVLAHELAHVVVNKYFTERPPYHIHELLAQFVEAHLNDRSFTV